MKCQALFQEDKIVHNARYKQGFSSVLKQEIKSCQRMHEPQLQTINFSCPTTLMCITLDVDKLLYDINVFPIHTNVAFSKRQMLTFQCAMVVHTLLSSTAISNNINQK